MDYSKLSDNTLKALKEGKPLDYSKLSDDELVELKKISKPSGPTVVESEAPSQAESFIRGAAQGGTFGFADEATGLLESLLTNKSYEQARDESRAAYKAAEAENPMTSLAGNLVGGFAIPVPGMGSAKTLGELAKQGAKYGVVGALGTTETDITNPDIIKDAAAGALIGGTAGGVIGGIGKGMSKITKAMPETTIGKSFSYGLKGQDLLGEEARKAVGRELIEQTGKSADEIQGMIQNLSDEQVALLKNATESGKKISTEDLVKYYKDAINDSTRSFTSETDAARRGVEEPISRITKQKGETEADDLLNNLLSEVYPQKVTEDISQNTQELTPTNFNALKKTYGNLAHQKELKDPDAARLATDLARQAKIKLEKEIPGIDKINANLKNMIEAQEVLNIGKGVDDLGNEISLTPLIQRLESDTVSSDVARAKFDTAIQKIKNVDPEKAMKIEKELGDIADKFQVSREINKPGSFTVNPLELARRFGAKAANPIGLAVNKSQAAPVAKVANKIFNAKPEALSELATRLEAKGSKFAPVVRKLVTEDTSKRNALMFTLMQQPAFREAIESEKEDGE